MNRSTSSCDAKGDPELGTAEPLSDSQAPTEQVGMITYGLIRRAQFCEDRTVCGGPSRIPLPIGRNLIGVKEKSGPGGALRGAGRKEVTAVVEKSISGGQTGADRAALDVALELKISCGGWCSKGRRAEDGRINDRYPPQETPSSDDRVRTRFNVEESHGTLLITRGPVTGGAALTIELAREKGKWGPHDMASPVLHRSLF
jgi:hypothetical protein